MRKPIDPKLFTMYYEPETQSIIAQQFYSGKKKVVHRNVSAHMAILMLDYLFKKTSLGMFSVDFESGCIGENTNY